MQHIDMETPNKYTAELDWWQRYFDSFGGVENFLASRKRGYETLCRLLPLIKTQTGKGLDLGCGLISIFEYASLDVIAIDPLLPYYNKIYELPESTIDYNLNYYDDGKLPFPDNHFQWVSCINVIDHTACHKELLSEISRVLVSGGNFYLQVNFDPKLNPPHHVKLWDRHVIEEELFMFKCVSEQVVWSGAPHFKDYYWGRFGNAKLTLRNNQ